MHRVECLILAALVTLCVFAASGAAFAQDSWAVLSQDLPPSLAWGTTGSVSVDTQNEGTTVWNETYALMSVEGEGAEAYPVDRWGTTAASVLGIALPDSKCPFRFAVTTPPLATLSYALPVTPTSPGLTSGLGCNWMLAEPYVPTAALVATDTAVESITIDRFPDVLPGTPGAWAAFYIEECAGRAPLIVSGYPEPDGSYTYRPGNPVDRGAMAVYMARALKLTMADYEGRFSDVLDSHWAWPWIEALVRANIVAGYPDGTYRPSQIVNRGQMAVYVARGIWGGMDVPTGPEVGHFSDVPDRDPGPEHWAYDEIEFAVAHDVVRGYPDGTYRPDSPVSRDQMAVFVYKGFIMPAGTAIVLGGPGITRVNPETAGYWGWSSVSDLLPGGQTYAYVVFDAVRLDTALAYGGSWEVGFELQGPVTRSYTASRTAEQITAARDAATASGVPHYAVSWALPTDLPEGDYTLVVRAKDETGTMQQVARQPSLSITSLRYQAIVPATLDLEERGELAINALTRTAEPESGYLAIYSAGTAGRNPPALTNLWQPPDTAVKYWDALTLLRPITGSDLNLQVDAAWEAYVRDEAAGGWPQYGPSGISLGPDARVLMMVADYYVLSGDPVWQQYGDQLVSRWWSWMVDQGTYCYRNGPGGMPTGWDATYHGWMLEALVHYHLATGSSFAIEFASKLARYLKDYAEVFDSEGHFLATHDSSTGPALHFHHNANSMQALAWYAWDNGDPEYAEFVRKGYEYAKSVSTPEVGYFPEYLEDKYPDGRPLHDTEVGCNTRDMMNMAILLTRMGVGDYWDEVDQTVRNMFAEGQLQDYQCMYDVSSGFPYQPAGPGESIDQAPERSVGAFLSWVMPNDLWMGGGTGCYTSCCAGNGARALYTVWQSILELSGGELRVNLLLNRASQWADLNSYIPYEGKVDLHMKCAASNVAIRIPNWVTDSEVSCTVNGSPRGFTWSGRYISLGAVNAGDLVQVTFPISERTVQIDFSDRLYPFEYTLVFKGNDVVSMDPPGTYRPLFQREHYRENVARWKAVTRVIADEAALPW
jgi:hypothetical protein